jgi:hypothetical protein
MKNVTVILEDNVEEGKPGTPCSSVWVYLDSLERMPRMYWEETEKLECIVGPIESTAAEAVASQLVNLFKKLGHSVDRYESIDD